MFAKSVCKIFLILKDIDTAELEKQIVGPEINYRLKPLLKNKLRKLPPIKGVLEDDWHGEKASDNVQQSKRKERRTYAQTKRICRFSRKCFKPIKKMTVPASCMAIRIRSINSDLNQEIYRAKATRQRIAAAIRSAFLLSVEKRPLPRCSREEAKKIQCSKQILKN